ncbi:DUF4302 domain-containing protein [Flavobacterium sp. MMLR14_040]|uniref:DUF4302 domain-containing protein n=1 Tax=Flavobacterium sp. MMLR14_040 TaxID=3093843 RepID=UPI002990068C|nr:DUF4302 domain-containing protein [Flavobacterium sp. MMLR14_040]MDW8848710.1 DUF4302 domain-containing protein [Flavobacterium sp. MMLR14_040]
MKIKNIFKYLIVVFAAILWGACTSTEAEDKFDQTPAERLSTQKKELNDLLLTSEFGWKAIYYTDSTQLGGWTHVFKFLPDGKVDMASDYDADTDIYRSQYEIQLGSAVSLVFTTANRIHLLSESDNYPTAALVGKGHLGDFQFFYYGQENGEIIFRTNRNFQELRFVKATAADWTNLAGNVETIDHLSGGINTPLFKILEINDGSAIHQFDFDYNADARFGVATPLDGIATQNYNMALSFTPTSAIVKPAIDVKGQKLSDFVYDSVSDSFIASGTGGVSATISFTTVPAIITDDYKKMLDGQPQFVVGYIAANLNTAPTTSKYFKSLIAKANATLPANQQITRIQLFFNSAFGNYIEYRFAGGKPSLYHTVSTSENALNKTIVLTDEYWDDGANIIPPPAFLAEIDAEFTTAAGLYVKKENFNITYTNTIYTITSASSSFRMTTYQL